MDIAKLMSFPIVASAHGHEIDFMIYLVHIIMIALFVGWGIFFIFLMKKYSYVINPAAKINEIIVAAK